MVHRTEGEEKEAEQRDRIASIHILQNSLTVHTIMSLPAPTPPQTRLKASAATMRKTQKELENVEGMTADMRMGEQAVSFLTSKEYLIHGNPVDLPMLSYVLPQLVSMVSRGLNALTDKIRVVIFLLTNMNRQQMADVIMVSVKTQLDRHMETGVG